MVGNSERFAAKRSERLPLLTGLFNLGIAIQWIADAAGVSLSTARKDLESAGLDRSKPEESKKVYRAVLCRYAAIVNAPELSAEDTLINCHLQKWLRLPEIMAALQALHASCAVLMKPVYPASIESYAQLVRTLFGGSWEMGEYRENRTWDSLTTYLKKIAMGVREPPTSHDQLIIDLAQHYLSPVRELIMPIWPDNVADVIDQVLKTLTPREEDVIRLLYGLGQSTKSFAEVANKYQVVTQRIRQIEGKALRKLRHPSRAKYFQDLAAPHRAMISVPLAAPSAPAAEFTDELDELSMSNLIRPVSEFEWSTRTGNCFNRADICYIWELADCSDYELLKTKFFGRKSLKEVKLMLAKLHLTTGSKFSESTCQELEKRTRQRPAWMLPR